MTNFKNIEYLRTGNDRQRKAYDFLIEYRIFERLEEFNPILTGTIPIGIDLPNSDLDIICECNDHDAFCDSVKQHFSKLDDFKIWTNTFYGVKASIASFKSDNFKIEIFGQNIPTFHQNAYRHMIIENQILLEKGLDFKKQIIDLKTGGLKTEPAFAKLLGLKGDPYLELLKFDSNLVIREIKPTEYSFLREMLYQAIYVSNMEIKLPREIIDTPELKRYIENFGVNNDFCLVAEQRDKLIGAIWIRLFDSMNKGYGFVDDETPELSMAVLAEYRCQGVGKELLKALIDKLTNKFKRISLSVDKENYAYGLYKKFGFVDYLHDEKSIIMTREMIKKE